MRTPFERTRTPAGRRHSQRSNGLFAQTAADAATLRQEERFAFRVDNRLNVISDS